MSRIEITKQGYLVFIDPILPIRASEKLSFKEVLAALKGAKNFGKKGNPNPAYGICRHLRENFMSQCVGFTRFVGYLSSDWEKFSGNLSYPINTTKKKDNGNTQYRNNLNFWSTATSYGRTRQELLDHMIKKLELILLAQEVKQVEDKIAALIKQHPNVMISVTTQLNPKKPTMGNTVMNVSVRPKRGNY